MIPRKPVKRVDPFPRGERMARPCPSCGRIERDTPDRRQAVMDRDFDVVITCPVCGEITDAYCEGRLPEY